ncbi:MAG: bifunctional phosphoribosylaminoimidazolecarboxamide formyltransferase/IMP cyclohydrolase PurH [Candidatus Meridianibacter frigidus]|nr:MAG: bifunctional phosphoribosylaminoimidazolecarboxamide formyltransferase/IMP cyclohydrolase PurH [Candidatus Eremiobacteraeota bacterium]
MPNTVARAAALFSLSDKTGVISLARALVAEGVTIYATDGTRAHLESAGVAAREVEDLTGFPALFDGRVKTLHPKVFGGILSDRSSREHAREAEQYNIPFIATVAVNLYPFASTIAKSGTTLAEAIEQIDVGGVSLLRAGAKNFAHVSVLSDPAQYDAFIGSLPAGPDLEARRRLAIAAFERNAQYDATIAHYLSGEGEVLPSDLPGSLTLTLPLAQRLRYGENPWSRAAFYLGGSNHLPEQLWGKALSYNNMLDLDGTLRLLARAPIGAQIHSRAEEYVRAVIVKHTVPCGVAQRSSVGIAAREALAADPVSAFGGIAAVDSRLDVEAAAALSEFFLEIVAAPEFDDDALALLKRKKHLRIMRYDRSVPEQLQHELRVRSALGGVLAEEDEPSSAAERWHVVSKKQPTAQEWHDLAFAWDIVRHVKSNGVVMARDGVTVGICAGQTNRVSAVRIAGVRAGAGARNSACASDGFFPFADGLQEAAQAGCSAVIAPQGSIRDQEVIDAADNAGIALVFSTHRYFLH